MNILMSRKKKRLLALVSMLCSFLIVFSFAPGLPAEAAGEQATTTDYLNLREGPGTNYKVMLTLIKGATLTVLEDDGAWVKVRTISGKQGYCSKEYLSISGSSSGGSSGSNSGTATTTANLNLRTGAGTNYNIITTIPKGKNVTVLDNSGSVWVKVQYGSSQGYCSREYLNITSGGGSSSSSSSGSAGSGKTAVTTVGLRLRSGPGTNYKTLTILDEGVSLTVLDTSNGSWTKVKTSSGMTGYCSTQYLKISSGTSSGSSSGGNSGGGSSSGTVSKSAVTTDYLNLRSGPGTNYSVLLTLTKGATLTVIDDSNASWAKVRTVSGKEGYCSKEYLKYDSGSSSGGNSGGSSSSAITVATTTANLKLRQGPSTSYAYIVVLPKGTKLTVTDNSMSGWAKVKTADGKQGYCSKEFLDIKTEAGTPEPAPEPEPDPEPEKPEQNLVATTTANLRLRSGPGTSYSVILTLSNGTKVTVIDNSDPAWAKVRTAAGKEGYCSKEFLKISTDSSSGGSESEPTIVGATVTVDGLRLRKSASTSSNILAVLNNGTKLTVLDTSNADWTKVKTAGGVIGYVSTEYIKFRYSNEPEDPEISATTLKLSNTSASVPVGRTLYLKATVTPSNASVTWKSSNTEVAVVENGYVEVLKPGTVTITASSGGKSVSCAVTATAAEPVRTAYTSPNIAGIGEQVTLTAVTDTSRDGVQFVVTMQDGSKKTVQATKQTTESVQNTHTGKTYKTIKWTASVTFDTTGNYSVTAVSAQNGKYSSAGYTTSAYVVQSQDYTVSSTEDRRASDKIINMIANWEGFSSTVYADMLTTSQVPTLGYGYTFGAGATFYNNISKTEGWSLLVNTINKASYTTEVNRFMRLNGLKMNQNQADCLISFGYNVGSGYWNGSSTMDARTIMLNAVVPPDTFPSGGLSATVTKSTNLRSSASMSASILSSVSSGTQVKVVGKDFSDTRDGWYQVTVNGKTGWLNSGYVRLSGSYQHDLNYTNAYAFGTDLLRWCNAGGKPYSGLLYRRLGEANVYNYNDYSAARYNKYGYTYPSAFAGYA